MGITEEQRLVGRTRRIRLLILLNSTVALLTVAVFAYPGLPGTGSSRAAAAKASDNVYKVEVTLRIGRGIERWTEWIAPGRGAWRMQGAGKETIVFDGQRRYALTRLGQGTYVRAGSRRFLSYLAERSLSIPAVRAYVSGASEINAHSLRENKSVWVRRTAPREFELRYKGSGMRVRAMVARRISASQAERLRLFVIPERDVISAATERPVGARPALPIRAYWFGPSIASRVAETTVEHRLALPNTSPRRNVSAYMVFYELPAALGATTAYPGVAPPEGELQVVSLPIDSAAAQGAIAAFNGRNGDVTYPPWPRFTVDSPNGETLTVVPDHADAAPTGNASFEYSSFSVITPTTLVSVVGPLTLSEIRGLAAQLRPIE